LFLQIFDEGRLTDSKGVTVDFRNAIIIMTSNLGGDIIREVKDKKEIKTKIWEMLHKHFKPEFLNRLDAVVIYNSLSARDIVEISRQQLEQVRERMRENNIELKISEDVALYFAEIGYDPLFGARPLRRAIEEKLIDEVAMRIIEGTIKPGDVITPKVKGDKIIL
jgi:ATP-dependent Clp protease ATP-binding subunit ClpB